MARQISQAFIVYVESPVCNCTAPRKELFHSKNLDRAVSTALAHWSLYVTFYGELVHWFDIIIVDTRDGVMMWRNGHQMKEVSDGESRTS